MYAGSGFGGLGVGDAPGSPLADGSGLSEAPGSDGCGEPGGAVLPATAVALALGWPGPPLPAAIGWLADPVGGVVGLSLVHAVTASTTTSTRHNRARRCTGSASVSTAGSSLAAGGKYGRCG